MKLVSDARNKIRNIEGSMPIRENFELDAIRPGPLANQDFVSKIQWSCRNRRLLQRKVSTIECYVIQTRLTVDPHTPQDCDFLATGEIF